MEKWIGHFRLSILPLYPSSILYLSRRKMSDTCQAGGHKGILKNANSSEESKQQLHELLEGDSKDTAERTGNGSQERKNPGNGPYTFPRTDLTM